MNLKELCFELTKISATSGDEKIFSSYLAKRLNKFMPCKTDCLGNVIGTCGDGKLHILLDAHIDQIGLIVRGIDDKGFLLVDKIGSTDIRVLTGSEVTVHGREDLFGVVCSVPPHLQSGDNAAELNLKEMAIDIGLCAEDAKNLVSIGDRITFRAFENELINNRISTAALDNRVGVAAILGALEIVKDKLNNIKLSVLFSVQEEVGCRGAGCGAFSLEPDCAIVVDVGFGNDAYTDKALTIRLGNGPSIGVSPILDKKLSDEIMCVASEKNIPVQNDVMGRSTGTNVDSISTVGCGIRTALLSVPLRYMHTYNEVVAVDDIEFTSKLIAEYLLKKEAELNA